MSSNAKTCFLMIRDIPAGEEEAGLEWGVDYGLADGETLPEDVEDLSEAQYTVFRFVQTLRGTFEAIGAKELKGDAPSGLIVPK